MKKTELKLDNGILINLPPEQAGFCQSCKSTKGVFEVSGFELDRITSHFCFACIAEIFGTLATDYKFKYCKACEAILCFDEPRRFCIKCDIEQKYHIALKYDPAVEAAAFLSECEAIVKEADAMDIN